MMRQAAPVATAQFQGNLLENTVRTDLLTQAVCTRSEAAAPPAPMAALGALGSRQVFARFEGLRVSSPLGGATPCVPALSAQRRCRHAQLQVSARQGEVSVGLFGTKAGMTQIFTDDGLALPATVIALEEGNVVAQIKTVDTDGYNAVQVGRIAVPAHMWRPYAHAPIRWLLAPCAAHVVAPTVSAAAAGVQSVQQRCSMLIAPATE